MFKCTVCDVRTTSVYKVLSQVRVRGLVKLALCSPSSPPAENNLQQHLRGRAHLKRLERKAVAESSVYVHGFPEGVSRTNLRIFFNQSLGEVKDLWISKKVPPYALVQFFRADDALKALQIPELNFNGIKLVIKPRKTAIPQPVKITKSSKDKVPVKTEASETARGTSTIDWDAILHPQSTNSQLQSLCESVALPHKAIKDQLEITFQLLQQFRPKFPRCMIVPFGSAISGLGTVSSDCDMSFFSDPPTSFVALLTGSRYFSSTNFFIVEELEVKYGVTFCPPQSLSSSQLAVSSENESDSYTSTSSPRLAKNSVKARKRIYEVSNLLHRNDKLSHFFLIKRARCPIIKFVHIKTSFSCDISIDSYLGVLNTRLIKAYCDFDERVVVLIRLVKHWARDKNVARSQLNSYALYLMTIFALQQSSPPVLPCLQFPTSWPKNTEWHKQQNPPMENEVDYKLTSPYRVNFVPPQFLMPTKNDHSTANLLHHFFNFYANVFDSREYVVCVRSSAVLSKLNIAYQVEKSCHGIKTRDFLEALVVQDPFDLSHNVTRSLHSSMLRTFQELCMQAATTLQVKLAQATEVPSVRSLLTTTDEGLGSSSSIMQVLSFTPEQVLHVLQQHSRYKDLAVRLDELDWTNIKVQHCIGRLLLVEFVQLLSSKFGFICDKNKEEEMPLMEEQWDVKLARQDGLEVNLEGTSAVESFPSSTRKRGRSWSDQEVEEESNAADKSKRGRVERFGGPEALDRLYGLLEEQHYPHSYTCTAFTNTWVRQIQEVKQQQQKEGTATSMEMQLSSCPSLNKDIKESGTPPPPIAAHPISVVETGHMPASSTDAPVSVLKFQVGLVPSMITSVVLHASVIQGQVKNFLNLLASLKKLMTKH